MAQVLHGDCLEVLKTLPDDSIDSIVTDPPAGIAFMGKDWDKDKGGRSQWIAWMSEVAAECLRVIKPGGHALVWAIPRTSHWTGTAWEDSGWEARDKIFHCFGSGFPKSLDVSKAIDRAAGAERESVKRSANIRPNSNRGNGLAHGDFGKVWNITAPATPEAKQWEGWGTALKPAVEEWWLFRKPLAEKTVAANVLEHGTGALNIDGCRVEAPDQSLLAKNWDRESIADMRGGNFKTSKSGTMTNRWGAPTGRFPAHLIHDGSEEVLACFGKGRSSGVYCAVDHHDGRAVQGVTNFSGKGKPVTMYGDSGSAARFFYCAKASKRDRDEGLDGFELKKNDFHRESSGLNQDRPGREGRKPNLEGSRNYHPTVKPTELMRYLCRLITPPGGLVLDPFCGSGSTGKGAVLEGFNFIGIEQDPEYCKIARARIAHVSEPVEPTLEERVQWLETQVKAQSAQIKKLQGQQLNLFAL